MKPKSSNPPIGLIGCGLLGQAMAVRLIAGGFTVLGHDIDRAAMRRFARLGGIAAGSAAEVADRARRIVLSLPDSRVVAGVVRGIRNHLNKGTLLIDTTTGDPGHCETLAHELSRRGVRYIDACVVGSSAEAAAGQVIVLAGGQRNVLRSAADLLACFTRQVIVAGAVGSGMRLKLVINLVLGLNRAVLAEGLALAEAAGIELRKALDALRAGAAYSRVMDTKGPKMIRGDFRPQARLAQHWKDVKLIKLLGKRTGASLPLSTLHERLLRSLVKSGCGDLDNSAILKAFSG